LPFIGLFFISWTLNFRRSSRFLLTKLIELGKNADEVVKVKGLAATLAGLKLSSQPIASSACHFLETLLSDSTNLFLFNGTVATSLK
jgi:hypothetical protein